MLAASYGLIVEFLTKCPCIDTNGDGSLETLRAKVLRAGVANYIDPGYDKAKFDLKVDNGTREWAKAKKREAENTMNTVRQMSSMQY
jgi:hypothetical protein